MKSGRATQSGWDRPGAGSDTMNRRPRKRSGRTYALEPPRSRGRSTTPAREAYDQVIGGYLLQIGEELKTAEGQKPWASAAGTSLVGSLKESTLGQAPRVGRRPSARRKSLRCVQGITVAAVTIWSRRRGRRGPDVSHSMLRCCRSARITRPLGPRAKTDPSVREVMRRLVDDWSLDDPNPEAYRRALESISSTRGVAQSTLAEGVATECEPERMVQMAIEVGAMGPQVRAAMTALCSSGRVELLLDLVEKAPSSDAGAPVWDFLTGERVLESLLEQMRVDIPLITRFVRRLGASAAPTLSIPLWCRRREDAGAVLQLLDLGEEVSALAARANSRRSPVIQRELLALLGVWRPPHGFSPRVYLENADPLVRREAVRILLREPAARRGDDIARAGRHRRQSVVCRRSPPHGKLPRTGLDLIGIAWSGRAGCSASHNGNPNVGRSELQRLFLVLGFVMTRNDWSRRPKLRPSSPEMLAALSVISCRWTC